MEKRIPEIFTEILEAAGIDHVFGMPGGCTPMFFDALIDREDKVKTVLARHEGAAAVMADAYARHTGKPALLMGQGPWIGTSGGYGIIESYTSGLPMIILCDLSDYHMLPLHNPYQNVSGDYGSFDLPQAMKGMTKFSTVATNPGEFIHGLRLAIKHAVSGRPGPAAVMVKWNVPFMSVDPEKLSPPVYPLSGHLSVSSPSISRSDAYEVAEVLAKAEKPVLILGQGARTSRGCGEAAASLAEYLGVPIATSFLGKSAVPETHPCAVGVMGAIGQKSANEAVSSADVILAVGTGLAPDNTKWLDPSFIDPEKQKIIQIDIDARNAGWTFPLWKGIVSDAAHALEVITMELRGRKDNTQIVERGEKRRETLKARKAELRTFCEAEMDEEAVPIPPERVVKAVQQVLGEEDLLVLDGGNNRMWFTHHFQSLSHGQVLAGGGVAAVGYGAPAALAVQAASPGRKVIAVTGDGGMMMQVHSLETARDLDLPVTFIVLNNSCLGNVRDYQPEGRRIATEYSSADFASIARGFGIEGVRVEDPAVLDETVKKAHAAEHPVLVEVMVRGDSHFKLMETPPAMPGGGEGVSEG